MEGICWRFHVQIPTPTKCFPIKKIFKSQKLACCRYCMHHILDLSAWKEWAVIRALSQEVGLETFLWKDRAFVTWTITLIIICKSNKQESARCNFCNYILLKEITSASVASTSFPINWTEERTNERRHKVVHDNNFILAENQLITNHSNQVLWGTNSFPQPTPILINLAGFPIIHKGL